METTLSSTAHDKKAAQMENAQLTTQLEQSQKVAYTAQSAREAIAQELTTAEAQANDLRRIISRVEDERDAMKDVVHERDQVRPMACACPGGEALCCFVCLLFCVTAPLTQSAFSDSSRVLVGRCCSQQLDER